MVQDVPLDMMLPTTSNLSPGLAVPMPTLPEASMRKGVVSVSPVSSLTLNEVEDAPPKLVTIKAVVAFNVPELVIRKRFPVLAALEPERVISKRLPVKAVADEEISRASPDVNELPVYEKPVVVVPVKL